MRYVTIEITYIWMIADLNMKYYNNDPNINEYRCLYVGLFVIYIFIKRPIGIYIKRHTNNFMWSLGLLLIYAK